MMNFFKTFVLSIAVIFSYQSIGVESAARGKATMSDTIEQGEPDQRHLSMKMGTSTTTTTTSSSSSDDEFDPVVACNILALFDSDGRGIGNDPNIPGFEWDEYCYAYQGYNDMLCPSDEQVENICAHKNPHLNPAVNQNFCNDRFVAIGVEFPDLQADCTKYCTNYVSMDRGGCCYFTCD